jgi:hypothetical protein
MKHDDAPDGKTFVNIPEKKKKTTTTTSARRVPTTTTTSYFQTRKVAEYA